MDVLDVMRLRKSVRSYEPGQIPDETLSRILEAGRIAPSASNSQPWHFIVVKDADTKKVLSEGIYAHFLTQCPIVVVGCGDSLRSPKWYTVDVTIALQQMVLVATGEGLGTCWIGSFSEDSVKKCLGIPEEFRVVAMLALGYPKDSTDINASIVRPKNRKPIDEIVSIDKFKAKRPIGSSSEQGV